MKLIAVDAVSLSCLRVRQTGDPVDRGMQVRVIDPRLLRSRLAPLGSFGLCEAATAGASTTTVRDSSDLLHIDVGHLTRSLRNDDLWFSVVLAVRVDESTTIQPEVPQDIRDRPTSNDDAVFRSFERDP